jgi:hypothetical protein
MVNRSLLLYLALFIPGCCLAQAVGSRGATTGAAKLRTGAAVATLVGAQRPPQQHVLLLEKSPHHCVKSEFECQSYFIGVAGTGLDPDIIVVRMGRSEATYEVKVCKNLPLSSSDVCEVLGKAGDERFQIQGDKYVTIQTYYSTHYGCYVLRLFRPNTSVPVAQSIDLEFQLAKGGIDGACR